MGGEFLSAALIVGAIVAVAIKHHLDVWKSQRVDRDADRFFGRTLAIHLRLEAVNASLRRHSGDAGPGWRQDTEDALADAYLARSVAAYQHAFSLVKRDVKEGLITDRDIRNHV